MMMMLMLMLMHDDINNDDHNDNANSHRTPVSRTPCTLSAALNHAVKTKAKTSNKNVRVWGLDFRV